MNEIMSESVDTTDLFGDKICDDLCQLLLSGLSLKDKIRLEAVSKQFQRCVYQRQYSLHSEDLFWDQSDGSVNAYHGLNETNLEALLKKCHHLDTVYMPYHESISPDLYNCLIELIMKYCHHLTDIFIHLSGLSTDTVRRFGQQFAKSVTTIGTADNLSHDLKLLPNVRQFGLYSCSAVLKDLFDGDQCLVHNITKCGLTYGSQDDYYLQTFVANNSTLKEIYIGTYCIDTNDLCDVYRQLSRLEDMEVLRHRDGWSYFDTDSQVFVEALREIGMKLRTICIDWGVEVDAMAHKWLLFNQLIHLKSLKRFEIIIQLFNAQDLQYQSDITSKMFSQCIRLTQLSLTLYYGSILREGYEFTDEFFDGIDTHLPQITHLSLRMVNISDVSIDKLTKVPKLEKLVLYSRHVLSDDWFYRLQENCPEIKSIRFQGWDEGNHRWIIKTNDSLLMDRQEMHDYKTSTNYALHLLNSRQSVLITERYLN